MTKPTMSCERALRLLAAYLDRELNELDHAEIERHLEACRSCYSRMEFEKLLKVRLAELGHREPDQGLAQRVRQLVLQFGEAGKDELAG